MFNNYKPLYSIIASIAIQLCIGAARQKSPAPTGVDLSPKQVLATPSYYFVILAMALACMGGLMMIGFAKPIAVAKELESTGWLEFATWQQIMVWYCWDLALGRWFPHMCVTGYHKNIAATDISLMFPTFIIAAICAGVGILLISLLKVKK